MLLCFTALDIILYEMIGIYEKYVLSNHISKITEKLNSLSKQGQQTIAVYSLVVPQIKKGSWENCLFKDTA